MVPLLFGRLLKRLRTQAGMERADLGSRTGYSAATIASFEQGRRIPPARFIMRADEVLTVCRLAGSSILLRCRYKRRSRPGGPRFC
ncbi:helix-turn-helix domain-containing protein [Streptomyces puniciscabiei]|uniref:helix-turn-helix domain-containing protein n=1 Tax=Streptomyces puniciscabiei TaxID=164348 RepID=UPI003791CF0C